MYYVDLTAKHAMIFNMLNLEKRKVRKALSKKLCELSS